MRPNTFFITGTAGIDQAQILRDLREALPGHDIHGFDDLGVPPYADEEWRRTRTAEWLSLAQSNAQQGKITVICGVVIPHDVEDLAADFEGLEIRYGLIGAKDDTIRTRLRERAWPHNEIEQEIENAHHLHDCVVATAEHFIVASDDLSLEDVAKAFAYWIRTSST